MLTQIEADQLGDIKLFAIKHRGCVRYFKCPPTPAERAEAVEDIDLGFTATEAQLLEWATREHEHRGFLLSHAVQDLRSAIPHVKKLAARLVAAGKLEPLPGGYLRVPLPPPTRADSGRQPQPRPFSASKPGEYDPSTDTRWSAFL